MSINIQKMPKLGFGLMRLPESDDGIDVAEVQKLVDTYMDNGFNYFDTAYVYHGGKSEEIVKEVLVRRYPRDTFYLATKLPPWNIKKYDDIDRIFNEQLERTGVDYFDFYLLHNLEDGLIYETFEKFDCFDWIKNKKASGQVRHIGFSFHGTPELLEKVLNEHPEVEFVQIQVNYADWENPVVQSGKLYDILSKRQIPILVMEPVKGGLLASLQPEMEQMLKTVRPNDSIASWALRFASSLPGVVTTLSGMSTEAQMNDNLYTFSDFKPLNEQEKQLLRKITEMMLDLPLIQCTSCRYCCDGCPEKIRVPDIFGALNAARTHKGDTRPHQFYESLVNSSGRAKNCIACGKCEAACPQHLPIVELMQEAANEFDA